MMQQGDFVADVCFYYGDQAPNLVPSRRIDPNIKPRYTLDKCLHCGRPVTVDFRPLGSGYDYDYIDANSIINRMKVDPETGQLVVGDMRYRVMVLPKHDHIDLEVMQKIRELVKQGAAIVGSVQPVRTNSLTDYPAADRKVARIGVELWGAEKPTEVTAPRSLNFGKGTVYVNMTSRQALTKMGVNPDFTVLKGGSQEGPDRVDYIHRCTDNADIYFVSNGVKEAKSLLCRFRDAEGRPEIWDPVSGEIYLANTVSRQPDNSCNIELELPAIGSVFVVFRREGQAPNKISDFVRNVSVEKTPIKGKWTVKFQPGRLAPESVEWNELIDWTSSEEPGIKYFSGTAAYSIQFEMPKSAAGDFWLDLGKVCAVGQVSIDEQFLGTAWTYPFGVKVPAHRLSKGPHKLEVKVTNVWNNRLVGDQFLPEEERITRTNLRGQHTKDSPLGPSGLLGPVTLQPAEPRQTSGTEAVEFSAVQDAKHVPWKSPPTDK